MYDHQRWVTEEEGKDHKNNETVLYGEQVGYGSAWPKEDGIHLPKRMPVERGCNVSD